MGFVRAHPEHDDIVVAHYLAIWESYGTQMDIFGKTRKKSSTNS
jgi:hypothetical protein